MSDKVNKKELEAKIKTYKKELEELQNQVAVQDAGEVLEQIMDSVMKNTTLCQSIGKLTKDKCKAYVRQVVKMYEKAFAECEPEFAELEKKKEQKAARRKESAARLQTAKEEQDVPMQDAPQQGQNGHDAYRYAQQ